MRHIIVFLSILSFAFTASAQQGWVPLNAGISQDLGGVFAVNRDTVYVTAADVFRTTNGGLTWDSLTGLPAYGNGYVISWLDDTTGFLLPGLGGTLFKTTNGGETWTAKVSGAQSMNKILFVGNDSGWILGTGEIARTTDRGETWSKQFTITLPYGLAFSDSKHGFMMGELEKYPPKPSLPQAACFETTTDGGATWAPQYSGIHQEVRALAALSSNKIIAAGDQSLIALSTDGGNNWDTTSSQNTHDVFLGISFCDDHDGFIVGTNGWIVHTFDGESWLQQNSGVIVDLFGVVTVDSLTAYATGANGTILKTTDAGHSWVNISPVFSGLIQGTSYPEPCITSTNLSYTLPEPQHVALSLNGVTGATVANVLNGAIQNAGQQSVTIDTSQLASGTYVYVLQSEKYFSTGRITVIH